MSLPRPVTRATPATPATLAALAVPGLLAALTLLAGSAAAATRGRSAAPARPGTAVARAADPAPAGPARPAVPTPCGGRECAAPSAPATSCSHHSPELLMLGDDDVAYTVSADAPYRSGQVLVLTATTTAGSAFGPVPPAGWVRVSSAVETRTVTLPRC